MAIAFSIGSDAFATNKIAKFDTQTYQIATGTNRQWKTAKFVNKLQSSTAQGSDVTLGPTEGYSILLGPDGTQWYATQSYTENEEKYYSASTITLFDSRGEQQGEIKLTIPEGENVNQIMVGNCISNNLFDRDNGTNELPIVTHLIHAPGVASYKTYIYNIASGELICSYNGMMTIVDYYTGFRTDWLGVLSSEEVVDGVASARYDIYGKPTEGDFATLRKTFTVPKKLAEYQVGSVLNVFFVDHKPYYVLSQYEKEYLDPASYEDPFDMIPTAENNFVATIYDRNFTQKYQFKIPVTSTKECLTQYGIGLFGFQDFSQNYWDQSGNMQMVVTSTNFEVVSGNEDINFNLYDMKGNPVKEIASKVKDWMPMYDIPGQPTQMAFLTEDGTSLAMVDMPSCETVVTFGSEIEEEPISTNIDRYAVGGGYQYVIALPAPEMDKNKNVYQRFAWVTTEAEIANIVKFNLGKSNASWIPLVMGEVLNPYIFDTDDMREYVFIANQYASGTTGKIVDELRIVKEDGTIVRTYKEDSKKGELGTCNLLGLHGDCPTIIVPFRNTSTDLCTIELDFLPYTTFGAGGDGTAENPYLISSIGDMEMMHLDLTAHYKVVKNFDASEYGLWTPTARFTGTFDGDNYTISNLEFDGTVPTPSIFGETENAVIKDLKLESPKVYATSDAYTIGLIAAEAYTSTFSNIHINNATIEAPSSSSPVIGTIVGNAYLENAISECFVNGVNIEAPGASPVGGIAGYTRTTSSINACAVNGTIEGKTSVGGIVGEASTACSVTNCHVTATLTGKNSVGGIAGCSSRGGIHACYVEGCINGTQADRSGYTRTGGIAGQLEVLYETEDKEEDTTILPWNGKVISNNVVNVSEFKYKGKAAHRIVGYSKWEADIDAKKYDSTIVPKMDPGFDKNYAIYPIAAIEEPTDTTAIASNEGETLAAENLTSGFLIDLGFKFGNTADAPWEETDNGFILHFEADCTGIDSVIAESDNVIEFNGNTIEANGTIALYNLSGIKVASGLTTLTTTSLPKGVYIVMVTQSDGTINTAKISVK